MRLRAIVSHAGRAKHLLWHADIESAWPVETPASIEIVEDAGAAYLLRLNASGVCVADTWHEEVSAAKAQAAFEYGINEDDWVLVA